jgi:hypothetical protein
VGGSEPSATAAGTTTAPAPTAALTIGEVARRTGLSTSTLRAWERRYGVLRPARSAGGHRRYGSLDLDRVHAVRHLISRGWSTEAAAMAVARDLPEPGPPGPGPSTTSADGVPPAPSAPLDRWGPVDGRPAPDLTAIGSGARGPLAGDPGGLTMPSPPAVATDAPEAGTDDLLGLRAAHRAACRLLRLEEVEEAPLVLLHLVEELGGTVVPADAADGEALPVDLGLGIVPPLLPVPAGPVARLQLERVLPPIDEDARRTVTLLRLASAADGGR